MKKHLLLAIATLSLSACVSGGSSNQIVSAQQSQVQLRSYQSRAFDTTDQNKTLRAVIATMQDLGFIVEKADNDLGTVSGSMYSGNMLKLTVTVFPKGKTQTQVRANLQRGLRAVETPEPYQNFFANLEKSMFLTAHGVD